MDFIAEAITAQYGERCSDPVEGCPVCDAWAQYDGLRGEVEVFRAALFEVKMLCHWNSKPHQIARKALKPR